MTSPPPDKLEAELIDLTNQPTAPAREEAVIRWVQQWLRRRQNIKVRRDRFGNMLIQRAAPTSRYRGTKQARSNNRPHGRPLMITAHMDHPAFVVSQVKRGGQSLIADFRGGVADRFFEGARIRLWQAGQALQTGRVTELYPATKQRPDKRAAITLDSPASAQVGDLITWRLPKATRQGDDRLRAPVCDDLAGVMAALHAFDRLRNDRGSKTRPPVDVRVLLTRCEEIGFIGAMGACRSGLVPKNARLVLLENSKSFADSPIGGGPIVRVGDKTSTFDPALTYRLTQVADHLAKRDKTFQYQRKLMPGGTCEATAYHTFDRAATCLCLPLGNYHNMNERTGKIDREIISLRDYHCLVRWLIELGKHIDAPSVGPPLQERFTNLFNARQHLINKP